MLTSRITDAAAGHNPAKLEHSAHEQLAAACLLPYYFAVCRLVRGLPLHAVQYVGRIYIAPERGTTSHHAIRSRNSQRDRLHGVRHIVAGHIPRRNRARREATRSARKCVHPPSICPYVGVDEHC